MVLQHCKVILVPFVKTLKESSPFFITLFRNFRHIQVWIQFFHPSKRYRNTLYLYKFFQTLMIER